MARIGKWALLMLVSSPALAQVQTPGATAPRGLSWGDAAVILAIVFIVMSGLSLFSWLERR